jgi:transposase-like protein
MNNKQQKALAKEAAQSLKTEEDIAALTKLLCQSFYEKALDAELDDHLGYDRQSEFEPQIIKKRQSRPLDGVYPFVYLNCIVLKIRQYKQVINKAMYLALGINMGAIKSC